jgi:hypothetical protein
LAENSGLRNHCPLRLAIPASRAANRELRTESCEQRPGAENREENKDKKIKNKGGKNRKKTDTDTDTDKDNRENKEKAQRETERKKKETNPGTEKAKG